MHVKLVIQCLTPPHNGVADTIIEAAPPCPWAGLTEERGWAQVGQSMKPELPGKYPEWQCCTWVHFVHFKATAFNRTNLF